jgi:hypothetical protein
MGREIRRVPADWQHPKDEGRRGNGYKPLRDGSWAKAVAEWDRENAAWERGERPDYHADDGTAEAQHFDQWHGQRPYSGDYMPDWPESERTHYQMYEDATEGTPISPVFATAEECARWCADNGASIFGHMTATYEDWLTIASGGCSPGMMLNPATGESKTLVIGSDS